MDKMYHVGDVVAIKQFDFDYSDTSPNFKVGLVGSVIEVSSSNRKHTQYHDYDFERLKIAFEVPVVKDNKANKGRNKYVYKLYDSEVIPLSTHNNLEQQKWDFSINKMKGNDSMENVNNMKMSCGDNVMQQMPIHTHGLASCINNTMNFAHGNVSSVSGIKQFDCAPIQRYFEKKLKKINQDFDEKYKDIISKDSIYSSFLKFQKEFSDKLLKNNCAVNGPEFSLSINCNCFSEKSIQFFEEKTRENISKLENERFEELNNLTELCDDCMSMIKLCNENDCCQDKLCILNDYGILKDGKIVD